MKIRTLAEWFDELPEEVKDKISDLVYDRDMQILEDKMDNFIANTIFFARKQEEMNNESAKPFPKLFKMPKIPTDGNHNTPITEQEIQNLLKKLNKKFKN
jgi:hypothetical protein